MQNDHCTLVIAAVQRENMTKVEFRILPNDEYYLRMRIKCNEMINCQMLRSPVFTGASSMISIESEEFETNMTAGVLLGMKQLEIHEVVVLCTVIC